MKMKNSNRHLECTECNGITRTVKTSVNHRRHGIEYRIDDVETEQCPKCGTKFFNADVIASLDAKLRGCATRLS
jgi:NAD-dependent SIR2 family protein deacetylase